MVSPDTKLVRNVDKKRRKQKMEGFRRTERAGLVKSEVARIGQLMMKTYGEF